MAIRVGTASWTDKTLIDCKRFYPALATNAEKRLRFYASRFPMVEVDSSYYAMPSMQNAELWVQRTPADFRMNIKAFRLMTGHQTSPDMLPADLQAELPAAAMAKRMIYLKDVPEAVKEAVFDRYLAALQPLRAAGKLGLVHFQFAPWVARSPRDKAHLAYCVQKLEGCEVSVEFRNSTWFASEHLDNTLAMLRDLGITHTIVDEPQGFKNSVPAVWRTTNGRRALVRLHGRNYDTWDIKGSTAASDRFNYDYPLSELQELADGIRRLGGEASDVDVVFNNNYEDQGQRNALAMMELLGDTAARPSLADEGLPF